MRIAAAGSVDDGKSTLIGRLLFETDSLYEDQLSEIDAASARGGRMSRDFAFATDGLREERERNVTVDAAYRHLRIGGQRFLLADAPGHAEYTPNMVTAASTADLLIVLVDASREATIQTRRHLAIAAWLHKPVLLAVNKMDLMGYDQEVFEKLAGQLAAFGKGLGCPQIRSIPISAFCGENVTERSDKMSWHSGGCLLEELVAFASGHAETNSEGRDACLPIQNVLASEEGEIVLGTLTGAGVQVGGRLGTSTIRRLWVAGDERASAEPGQPVAVLLDSPSGLSRGDWLSLYDIRSSRFLATIFWMHPDPMRLFMTYRLRLGPRTVNATVRRIANLIELPSGCRHTAPTVAAHELAEVEIELDEEIPLALYTQSPSQGSFIAVEPKGATVAAGTIDRILPRRFKSAFGTPVFWLTGLSGAGKSSIAEATIARLKEMGVEVTHLDGDSLRSGLCSDLGFSSEDRLENIRRTAEVAKLMAAQGKPVICSLISPLVAHREQARQILGPTYREVFIQCPLDECVRRDPKGLYARAISGTIPNFTGIGSPYEAPLAPDLLLDTKNFDLPECAERLAAFVRGEFSG